MDISLPDQRLKLFVRGRTDWRVENIGKNVKKSKIGRLIEGTSASAQQEDLEVNFPPPSSAYWRNEFKVHQVDRDTRKDGRVNGKEIKIKHGGMVWRRLHQCTRRPHHLATMATHPHHTKERCPTRHFEHNFLTSHNQNKE